ncbi:MAG: hypothetical protein ABI707_00070 [Ferruginibacter sp.]
MKIKLVQSGGLLPVTKEAVTEVDWTKDESEHLLNQIAVDDNQKSSMVRDGIDHTIEINNKEVAVNLEKASGKYAEVFDHLKKNLKIVKT